MRTGSGRDQNLDFYLIPPIWRQKSANGRILAATRSLAG